MNFFLQAKFQRDFGGTLFKAHSCHLFLARELIETL